MNWQRLYDMQYELDARIAGLHGLQESEIIEKKILALQVEVAELANETRCFKFWSTKGPSPKATILEEYVDGLHFMLSLRLFANARTACVGEVSDVPTTNQFLTLFVTMAQLTEQWSVATLDRLTTQYLTLATSLHLTLDEVEAAYVAKNEKNHQRQTEGY